MVGLLIGLAAVAAYVSWGTSLQVVALINAVASLWSNGVLANFNAEPQAAPDWAALVSMLTAFGSVGLLLVHWVLT